MRGRNVFMQSLAAHDVRCIFGNPGTTESPLIDGLADHPGIRYVTALHEGVALGAASYYAQATGKVGVVSLHVAPGLGNAIGMLYGAARAGSPMLVTAGQQDTRMRLMGPVLGHDLVALAAPVTKWSVEVQRADEMAEVLRRAFKVALDPPAGPVFFSLPIDVMEQETTVAPMIAGPLARAPRPAPESVVQLAKMLGAAKRPVIVAGDEVARAGAVDHLVALAESIGAGVWVEGLRFHQSFPTDHASARLSLPLDAAGIRKALGDADLVLLLGGPFFEDVWYAPGGPFPKGAAVVQIEATPEQLGRNHPLALGLVGDMAATLSTLVEALRTSGGPDLAAAAAARNAALGELKRREQEAYAIRARKAWDRTPISMPRVMAEIKAAMPADAVVVDETITASLDLARTLDFRRPGDWFGGRGGGIGQGLAGALGISIGMPGRPVVCISGDGSAMYSIQALWTAAHLGLPITFVILANGEYRILKHNLDIYRQRFGIASQAPYAHMDLATPALGFVEMAAGMGVAGTRIADPAAIGPVVRAAFAGRRPYLVEIAIEGKR